jgi:DNA-binding NtrC family response regulator
MAAILHDSSEILCLAKHAGARSVSHLSAVVRQAGFRIASIDTLRGVEDRLAGDAKVLVLCREAAAGDSHAVEDRRQSRIIGESEHIRTIRDHVGSLARFGVTTVITGPTGCGKEVVALDLHDRSLRRTGPLVALNCAAIPDELLEGELFGYEKGAFTGATRSYPGKLKLADGGTLFLDEIGELSPLGQAKLLRAIDTGSVYRLGARDPTSFDVRIIAATNRDLAEEVSAGRFRSDLYYRLAVAQVELWPLSRRRSDILPLARHFAHQVETSHPVGPLQFSEAAQCALVSYFWPGNARELRNCIELAGLSSTDGVIDVGDLPRHVSGMQGAIAPRSVEEVDAPVTETELIRETIRGCEGNKSEAAKLLGWSRMTLYRKMARLGLSEDV